MQEVRRKGTRSGTSSLRLGVRLGGYVKVYVRVGVGVAGGVAVGVVVASCHISVPSHSIPSHHILFTSTYPIESHLSPASNMTL